MDVFYSFLGAFVAALFVDRTLRAKRYRGPTSDHFNGKVFYNYGAVPGKKDAQKTHLSLIKWLFLKRHKDTPKWVKKTAIEGTRTPRAVGGRIHVTFINHSTVLIHVNGMNILTDPIWSNRVSPVSFLGPVRFTKNPVKIKDLPPIDVVLVSHNHYDHMDIPTLKKIQRRWDPEIVVPLGNETFLTSLGLKKVTELDWWEKTSFRKKTKISCVPANHFSSRALSDRNKTLWGGFVIETPQGDIYFAGDTGYGPFVEKIREHYPKGFRLGLIPIGAFKPEFFMGAIHVSPEQAMQIHRDLGIKTSVGIHFGTFQLANDDQDEPPKMIHELLENSSDPKPDFRILDNGDTVIL